MGYISIILSGVASLGVFVALISGIFFLVLSGLRWLSKVRSTFYEEELLRQNRRRPLSKSCINGGDTWNLMEANGNHQSFFSKLYFQNNSSDILENWKDEKEEENDKKQSKFPHHTQLFRELIEKKIEEIIGGSLDGIPVGRLSTHSSYLVIFSKYHSLLSQEIEKLGLALQSSILNKNEIDSKVLNHQILDLKKLLKQITSEITSSPIITDISFAYEITNSTNYDDIHDKTYEDILATAILNKVIGNFQNNTDSDILTLYQSNCLNTKTSEKDEEESISSSSSSDYSRLENLSFTLEEHIEEITDDYDIFDGDENAAQCGFEESNLNKSSFLECANALRNDLFYDDGVLKKPEEIMSETEVVNSTSSWEDNWLFQKKRFRSTPNVHHPVPVPMLVPKPSNNFRALVGGVDADDLSDMSDCSDSVFESRLITLTTPDSDDLNNESETRVGSSTDRMTDIIETVSADLKPQNKCQSKEIKEFFSEHLENTFTDDRDVEEENFNWSKNFDSNFTLSKAKTNTLHASKKEQEEMEYVLEDGEIKNWNESDLITNFQHPDVSDKKKEYPMADTDSKEYSNFPDDTTSNFFDEKNFGAYRVTRNYYINASKNPSGMISPKPLTRFSEEIEQVSKQKYENLSSQQCRVRRRNSLPLANVRETKWYSLPTMKRRMKENKACFLKDHHEFVFVDKKGKNLVSKYENESRSLNLLNVVGSSNHNKLSLQQHFSIFEQKALRENLSHFLMRARGASPNFILNPIFMADAQDFKTSDCSSYNESYDFVKTPEKRVRSSTFLMNYYQQKSLNAAEKGETEGRRSRESGYSSDIFDYSL